MPRSSEAKVGRALCSVPRRAAVARMTTPPTAKVSATVRKGGTLPVIAVKTASVDQKPMAPRPMRVEGDSACIPCW